MEELEKLRAWLLTYPGWEGALLVDHTQAVPGHFGLYPLGIQEVSRKEDVLGNVYAHCRSRFALYRVTTGQADNAENAAWLLDFQAWVQQQSSAGLAPRFGDVASDEQFRAEQGKLHKAAQVGTGTYVVTITAQYTKVYEESI